MMKFIASDIDAAKGKARRALGENAVVVAVRNLPSGDIEITASDKPVPAAPPVKAEPGFGDDARNAIDEMPYRSGAGARLNEPIEQRFSEDALARLTGSLSGGGRRREIDLSDKASQGLAALLRSHGVGEDLLAALIDGARRSRIDEDLYRMRTAFDETFTFTPLQFAPTAPIMLVGPTGAGKTSCCAKLAAAAMARGGSAFLMTADVGRAGAIEQIKTYGDTLGADYYLVETPLDVGRALSLKRPAGAVILDTPGVSPFDAGDFAALKSFQEAAGAEPVLVLPASGDAAEFVDWATAFHEFGVRRAVITKFDATKRVGAGLCAAYAGKMALAHFSETAFISEGLLDASPEFLARRFLASRPGKVG